MTEVQSSLHLNEELEKVVARTQYGDVFGGRAHTGAAVWLGKPPFLCIMTMKTLALAIDSTKIYNVGIPYALPPGHFQDPISLPQGFKYDEKLYITESTHAVQPKNDGQADVMELLERISAWGEDGGDL